MAQILLEKQTIYKDEVDMILDGKSKEEVTAFMTKKDEERKAKDLEAIKKSEELRQKQEEERLKKQLEQQDLKKQLESSGLITPEELDEMLKNNSNKKENK